MIQEQSSRAFGAVRWYNNTNNDVACTSVEKAEEYVEKYNRLAGTEECYVDRDVYLLLDKVSIG